jgi:Putative zinc-finger
MMTLFTKTCSAVRSDFSAYLDGAVSGRTMQTIAAHLKSCAACTEEFESLRTTQRAVAMLGTVKAPDDLGLKLRLAISRERARKESRWSDRFALQWHNVLGPLTLKLTTGLAASVALVGSVVMLLGVTPQSVMADDERGTAMSAPHYLYSASSVDVMQMPEDTVIVVAAEVNDRGRIYDYKILSGPVEENVRQQVEQHLLLSVFTPARVFGLPVRGRTLVTFSGISVRG